MGLFEVSSAVAAYVLSAVKVIVLVLTVDPATAETRTVSS
jgi:hypothetical protein